MGRPVRCWDCGQEIDIDSTVMLARVRERERILEHLDVLHADFRLAGNYSAADALSNVVTVLKNPA